MPPRGTAQQLHGTLVAINMTKKEQYIIDYLIKNKEQGYYIDIRNHVGQLFDNEADFELALNMLKVKGWIYEIEEGETLYFLNAKMKNSISFEFKIEQYKVLETGADGGHSYISTEVEFKGKKRRLTALFLYKSDEKKLKDNLELYIEGDLFDEGEQHSLMLLNTTIKK